MKKYYKTQHFRSKDGKLDIYFYWYTTKSGFLKFDVEIYAGFENDSGFCTRIAKYNTSENAMLNYIRNHSSFEEVIQ